MVDMRDTEDAMLGRYLALIGGISKPERLIRALALSALARELTWYGATRHVGHMGRDAVVERFLLQLYGPDTARRMIDMLELTPEARGARE